MRYVYEIGVSINTGSAFKSVGEMLSAINNSMADFGFDEKLVLRSTIPMNLTVSKALSPDDQKKVEAIILESYNKTNPALQAKIETFYLIDEVI